MVQIPENKEKKANVIKDYLDGMPIRAMEAKHNISDVRIYQILLKEGVERNRAKLKAT